MHGVVNVAREALRGVTFHNPEKAYEGYTLFCPWGDAHASNWMTDVWLIDMLGNIIHRWHLDYMPAIHAKFMPSGHLTYSIRTKHESEFGLNQEFCAIGTHVVEVDWDGNEVRKWETPYQHHDFEVLPNHHVLYPSHGEEAGIVPQDLAARWKGGRPGTELEGRMYSDNVYEVDENSNVVWEWIGWQHADPEIDTFFPFSTRSHWHTNAICKCKDGSVITSPRNLSMIHRIDPKTNRIVKRYGKGFIWGQHDTRELENGNVMCFDNGLTRPGYAAAYSRVVEMDPVSGDVVWQFKADVPSSFLSLYAAGAERLPNGNTLICASATGRLFEVTQEGELVWEYVNPIVSIKRGVWGGFMFRGHRITADYPGLKGKDLDPSRYAWENKLFGPGAFRKKFEPCLF